MTIFRNWLKKRKRITDILELKFLYTPNPKNDCITLQDFCISHKCNSKSNPVQPYFGNDLDLERRGK